MKQDTAYNLLRFLIFDLKQGLIKKKIQKWWISERDKEAKETALIDLWNDIELEADSNTYQSLAEVKQQLRHYNTKSPSFKFMSITLKIAISFILMLFGSGLAYFYFSKPDIPPTQMLTCWVGKGEVKQIDLIDGSVMRINSGSYVIYPDKFDGVNRVIYLQGEASFDVVKKNDQPFIVKTPHLSVEALGTKFNVEAYPNSDDITTTLEQGAVKVNIHNSQLVSILKPNDRLIYSHLTNSVKITKTDATKSALWEAGFIVFHAATFKEVVQTIERRFDVIVVYDQQKYHNQNHIVTITFSNNESLEQIMKVLKAMINGLDYQINKRQLIIK